MDVTDTQAVVERVRAWRNGGRPKVKAHVAFGKDQTESLRHPVSGIEDAERLLNFGEDTILRQAFAAVRSAMPDMELRVASPAYDLGEGQRQEGVVTRAPACPGHGFRQRPDRKSPAPGQRDRRRRAPVELRMLGPLAQDRVFAEVQQALCVFYPADRVPETFGLVWPSPKS
jgi:hypothetical protein